MLEMWVPKYSTVLYQIQSLRIFWDSRLFDFLSLLVYDKILKSLFTFLNNQELKHDNKTITMMQKFVSSNLASMQNRSLFQQG